VRRERHQQAFVTLTTSTLDALRDPLGIRSRTPGGEPIFYTGVMMFNFKDISGYLFVVRSSNRLGDGIDQVMGSTKIGSCSLQEEQMLRRSVEALISRRNCDGNRLPQSPCIGLAAPHQRQPGLLERLMVRRPATKRLGDVWMRPDITLGESPRRANRCTGDQSEHRQVNLHLSSESADLLCRRSRALP
jgi:hypothetical protein